MFLCMVIIYVAASFHQLFLATFFCQLVSKSCSQLLLVVGQFLSVVLNYSYDQKVYISCVFYYCQLSANFSSVVLNFIYDQKVYISCVFFCCQLSVNFHQMFLLTVMIRKFISAVFSATVSYQLISISCLQLLLFRSESFYHYFGSFNRR